ncbi:Hypothetical_protein [Hexamita inflata]|uniref:Hypothetical_protein n=1 Tax=Hexamita inflata TaxID=28002 RepID=A0ABP1J047_9EUKA
MQLSCLIGDLEQKEQDDINPGLYKLGAQDKYIERIINGKNSIQLHDTSFTQLKIAEILCVVGIKELNQVYDEADYAQPKMNKMNEWDEDEKNFELFSQSIMNQKQDSLLIEKQRDNQNSYEKILKESQDQLMMIQKQVNFMLKHFQSFQVFFKKNKEYIQKQQNNNNTTIIQLFAREYQAAFDSFDNETCEQESEDKNSLSMLKDKDK